MRRLLLTSCALAIASVMQAQEALQSFDWQKLADSGALRGGTVTQLDGRTVLKIENQNDTPLQTQVLTIDRPAITKTMYGISGDVRYEQVSGDGFLEMWNVFPPLKQGMMEGRYFSRTLGVSGPDGKIAGTSDWRPFVLPFNRTGTNSAPTRLEINLHLPGKGIVYLGPLALTQYDAPAGAAEKARAAGAAKLADSFSIKWLPVIGSAIVTVVLTSFAIGLMTWMASRGRAREGVMQASKILMGCGLFMIVIGSVIAAAVTPSTPTGYIGIGQGIVWFCAFAILHPYLKRIYDLAEIRRMSSLDAAGV